MATKPSTLPRPWCTNAVYLTGPFAGSAGKVDPGIGVAAEGHRPGANDPTAAEHENWQQNLVTASWLPWVNSGSALGAADAHIVETTSAGRVTLHGLTVTNLANEIAVSINGSNTGVIPTVNITNTTGSPMVQMTTATAASGGTCTITFTGAVSGDGFSVTASATSSGKCFSATVPAGSTSRGLDIFSESANAAAFIRNAGTGKGLEVISDTGPTLTLTALGATSTPLVLTPRTLSPVTPGSFWIDTNTDCPRFYDDASLLKDVWASQGGMALSSNIVTGPTTIGVTVTAATNNSITFVNGQRYKITMGVDVGRVAGSTSNVLVTATANGAALPFSGYTIQLFQAGGVSQIERGWMKSTVWTANANGNLVINLNLGPTAAGQVVYAQAFIMVEGHYI